MEIETLQRAARPGRVTAREVETAAGGDAVSVRGRLEHMVEAGSRWVRLSLDGATTAYDLAHALVRAMSGAGASDLSVQVRKTSGGTLGVSDAAGLSPEGLQRRMTEIDHDLIGGVVIHDLLGSGITDGVLPTGVAAAVEAVLGDVASSVVVSELSDGGTGLRIHSRRVATLCSARADVDLIALGRAVAAVP